MQQALDLNKDADKHLREIWKKVPEQIYVVFIEPLSVVCIKKTYLSLHFDPMGLKYTYDLSSAYSLGKCIEALLGRKRLNIPIYRAFWNKEKAIQYIRSIMGTKDSFIFLDEVE